MLTVESPSTRLSDSTSCTRHSTTSAVQSVPPVSKHVPTTTPSTSTSAVSELSPKSPRMLAVSVRL